MTTNNAEAGPSTAVPRGGASAYHESSQFRHWRYSPEQLGSIREELNKKSVEVVKKNQELERKAQLELNHNPPNPAPAATYLSVTDELLLLRFYCTQISKICRHGFGLPEVVEATAISYLKRFYLKNSVMEWHPKTIMPTCLFLAAKTTNYPVLIDAFIPKFAKLQASDIIDTEFLVAQSLSFEFWVRGAEKGVRGWFLEFQEQPDLSIPSLQTALPSALSALARSRLTDSEFLYSPSQISLAAWYIASPSLVASFLDWKYSSQPDVYGMSKERLMGILDEIKGLVDVVKTGEDGEVEVDLKAVRGVDKRLKGCTNPEKTPGTALYLQRKLAKESDESARLATKSLKAAQDLRDREMVFGDVIQSSSSTAGTKRQPLSPRVTIPSPNAGTATIGAKRLKLTVGKNGASTETSTGGKEVLREDGQGKGDVKLEVGGLGVKDEAMGMVSGGVGLKEVGQSLADEDE